MELIPAIDLLGGKVVRLRQGRYEEVTVYHDDPPALARSWAGQVERLHVVDLEGARAGQAVQTDLVRAMVAAFGPGVQVGGGVRSAGAVETYFELGVDRVVLGTAVLRDPDLVRQAALAHPDRIILAVDARQGMVAIGGWQEQTTRSSVEVVRDYSDLPLAAVLYTDIERDGMEVGPNFVETARLAREGGVRVIASGGIGTLAQLEMLAAEPAITAAIVGRALLERRFTLAEARAAARARIDVS